MFDFCAVTVPSRIVGRLLVELENGSLMATALGSDQVITYAKIEKIESAYRLKFDAKAPLTPALLRAGQAMYKQAFEGISPSELVSLGLIESIPEIIQSLEMYQFKAKSARDAAKAEREATKFAAPVLTSDELAAKVAAREAVKAEQDKAEAEAVLAYARSIAKVPTNGKGRAKSSADLVIA